jgi:DNA-binding NarL/FixJ family response regulator
MSCGGWSTMTDRPTRQSQICTGSEGALRLVVIDGHTLLHSVYEDVLESEGFVITAFGRLGSELIPLVRRHSPDAVVLELDLQDLDGITSIRRLTERFPEIPAVVLTTSASQDDITSAFEAGAKGYILKTVELDDLGSMLRQVLDGSIDRAVGYPSAARAQARRFTDRELVVLRLLAEGLSNGEIAARLDRTTQTVKFHLAGIYRKLGVNTRTGAVDAAINAGVMHEAPGAALVDEAETRARRDLDSCAGSSRQL